MTTKTFKVGDKVKVADDAKFNADGILRFSLSAGHEAVIVFNFDRGGNYTMKLTDAPNPCNLFYSCMPEYLMLISSTLFKVGDKVEVSDHAQFLGIDGKLVSTGSAGHEAIVIETANERDNLTLDVIDGGRNFSCLSKYLTLISSTSNPCVEIPATESAYCACGGPGKETGIGTLVFTVCQSCKKEKQ